MTYDELVAELHNKVSGETSQELVEFFHRDNTTQRKSHDIIMDDGEYALILSYQYNEGLVGEQYTKAYWIAGINDEQRYFVHRLEGIPESKLRHIQDIVSWMNRTDEGFVKRLQGDILIRFIANSQIWIDGKGRPSGQLTGVMPDGRTVWHGVNPEGWFIYDGSFTTGRIIKREHFHTAGEVHVDGAFSQIKLGNHTVSTNRHIIVLNDEYLVVGGDRRQQGVNLLIQHPEHTFEKLEIPAGHLAVLTGQRGRGIKTADGVKLSVSRNVGFD